jgi:hypothetical protein
MMGGHMPHEGLVDRRIASHPWRFAAVRRKQCGGAEPQHATNRAKALDSQKCPALKHLLFRRKATKPGEQRIHGCRGKVNEEADPVRLLQCKDWLPDGNSGTRTNHSSAEVRIAHGTAMTASRRDADWRSIFRTRRRIPATRKSRPIGEKRCRPPRRQPTQGQDSTAVLVLKLIDHFLAEPGSAILRCWLARTPAGVTLAAAD